MSKQTNSYQVPCSPHIFKLLTMFLPCIPGQKLITILLEWRPYTQRQSQEQHQFCNTPCRLPRSGIFSSPDTKADKTVLCIQSAPHRAGYISHLFYVPVGQRHGPIFSLTLSASLGKPAEGYPASRAMHFLSSEAARPLQGAMWRGRRINSWLPLYNSYHLRSRDLLLTELPADEEEHNNIVTGEQHKLVLALSRALLSSLYFDHLMIDGNFL